VDQEGPEIGGEDQLLAIGPVIERLFTGAVAGQQQAPARLVPHRDGKHPVEVFDEVGAVLLVEVRDDLGVGFGAQLVALGDELFRQIRSVVDLAVADRPDAAVLVGKGRRLGLHVDDGEPPEAQGAVLTGDVALTVGASVGHGCGHHVDQLPTLFVGPFAAQNANQTTHDDLPPPNSLWTQDSIAALSPRSGSNRNRNRDRYRYRMNMSNLHDR